MERRPRTEVDRVIEFVGLAEYRRLAVVVGVPALFAALSWERNSLGTAAVLLAVGLTAFLYTRSTARETVAAGAYATGALVIGLVLLELYWNWAGGSTASLTGVAMENRWRAATGALSIGLGLWIRRTEP